MEQAVSQVESRQSWLLREMLYQRMYLWFIFFAALDVVLTLAILQAGGREVNRVALAVLMHGNVLGLTLFKFGTVLLVVCICEFIGRRKVRAGRLVVTAAVVLNAAVVAWSLLLLGLHVWFHF